jgi:hypothetical protein
MYKLAFFVLMRTRRYLDPLRCIYFRSPRSASKVSVRSRSFIGRSSLASIILQFVPRCVLVNAQTLYHSTIVTSQAVQSTFLVSSPLPRLCFLYCKALCLQSPEPLYLDCHGGDTQTNVETQRQSSIRDGDSRWSGIYDHLKFVNCNCLCSVVLTSWLVRAVNARS